jgi:hypothetical protein
VSTPENSLQSCLQMMQRFNVRHVVVYNRFELRRVFSTLDLMQEAVNKRETYFVENEQPRRGYPWTY